MAIRGSKIGQVKKRNLKSRQNPAPRQRPSKKTGRKSYLKNLAKKHGVSSAIRKLKSLARKNPQHSDEIMNDALWLVNADTSGIVPQSAEIDQMLRNNPDFDWGPKLFNPLTDEHPFEKNRRKRNPEEIGGGLYTSIFNRRRNNPPESDVGGLFTPIYSRRNRRNP